MDRAVVFAPSVRNRKIPERKRGSRTGFQNDPFQKRQVWFESDLEAKWLLVLMADPDVHEVREQQRLPSFSHNGRTVLHYMDFLVTWRSGRRSACSVKYTVDHTPEFDALIRAMAREVGDDFADDYRTLSEANIGLNEIWNAARIVSAAKDFDLEAQAFLARELRSCRGWVSLAECDELLADGHRGSRAAKALIKTGRLVLPKGERLHAGSLLRNLFTN